MAWVVTLPADSSKISLSAGYLRNNQSAVQSVLSSTNLTNAASYIPSTAPMWFYVDTAPVGWTLFGVLSDSLLAVKGGTSQYNVAGGTQAGTWNGPPYTLTLANLPNQLGTSLGGGLLAFDTPEVDGTAHSHDWTTTRPQAYVGIICTKNA